MVKKFFPLDKNYLLEEAQLTLRGVLLDRLLTIVKSEYEAVYNPLGIPDTLTLRIRGYQLNDISPLKTFYETLSGVYRYKFSDNQLQFMWDGGDHLEKYKKEWSEFFADQVKSFCRKELFIKAVLDLTVFFDENRDAQMIENRMNNFMLQTFEVKIDKRKGLVRVLSA